MNWKITWTIYFSDGESPMCIQDLPMNSRNEPDLNEGAQHVSIRDGNVVEIFTPRWVTGNTHSTTTVFPWHRISRIEINRREH